MTPSILGDYRILGLHTKVMQDFESINSNFGLYGFSSLGFRGLGSAILPGWEFGIEAFP